MEDRADVSKRQKSWLARQAGKDLVTWRPIQLNRQGVARLLFHLDRQFAISTGKTGLRLMQQHDADYPEWALGNRMAINLLWVGPGWFKLEAAHALDYHLVLSSLPLFDISHGCHNSVENTLNAVGLKEF